MSLTVTRFSAGDRLRWTTLWTAYLDFYHTVLPASVFDHTWDRLLADTEIHGLAARDNSGQIVGIVHFLYHAHCWTPNRACYLQDLFVDGAARGTGAGRTLIEAVAGHARTHGADRLYWLTQDTNASARLLYDRLARQRGFIRYEYPPLGTT